MFGWFSKKDAFPELTTADRLIIKERSAASKNRWAAYEARKRADFKSPSLLAYANAELDLARERDTRAEAAYVEMMQRLTAEARAAISKAGGK